MRQYYVAMGSLDVKLATLTDLLQAFSANGKRKLAVCCNARDALDDIAHAVEVTHQHQIFLLFSDMFQDEKERSIQQFREKSSMPDEISTPGALLGTVLMTTDFALKSLTAPVGVDIVINYDLPTCKEMMVERFGKLFGVRQADPEMVVVNFIVAGMMETFRKYEEMNEEPIEVMPLHVADIFTETVKP